MVSRAQFMIGTIIRLPHVDFESWLKKIIEVHGNALTLSDSTMDGILIHAHDSDGLIWAEFSPLIHGSWVGRDRT